MSREIESRQKQIIIREWHYVGDPQSKEGLIKLIFQRNHYWSKLKDSKDRRRIELVGNYITKEQLTMDLDVKDVTAFVRRLVSHRIVRVEGEKLFYNTDESYCRLCSTNRYAARSSYNSEGLVLDFLQEDHIRKDHGHNDTWFAENDLRKVFSKTQPIVQPHEWQFVGVDQDNYIHTVCKHCGHKEKSWISSTKCELEKTDFRWDYIIEKEKEKGVYV